MSAEKEFRLYYGLFKPAFAAIFLGRTNPHTFEMTSKPTTVPEPVNDNAPLSARETLAKPGDDPALSYGATEVETKPKKELPEAAKRALAEAEERRQKQKPLDLPNELDGRDGPEPTRYGDWEKDGIVSDF